MRTQLLPPFLADDFKCKLLEITCHVVRALYAWRGPYNFTQNAITLTVANSSIISFTFPSQKMKLVLQYWHNSFRIRHSLVKCSWRCFCNRVFLQPLFVHFTPMKLQWASCFWKKKAKQKQGVYNFSIFSAEWISYFQHGRVGGFGNTKESQQDKGTILIHPILSQL